MEALLRAVLPPRDRDTVSGDLLEEYREEALPALGECRAGLWYFRQMLSLLSVPGLCRLAWRLAQANSQAASLLWTSAGILVVFSVFFLLASNHFGPPRVPLPLVAAVAAALALAGTTAIRSTADARLIGRTGLCWGGLFTFALVVRMVFDALVPFNREETLPLEHGADRGLILGVAIAIIYLAAGFSGAWRTGRFRTGTLTALSASAIGSLSAFFVTNVVVTRVVETWSASTPVQVFALQSAVFWRIIVFLLLLSAVLGSIGAMFGRGLHGILRRQNSAGA